MIAQKMKLTKFITTKHVILDYNFIVKERNEFVSCCNEIHCCIHIETANLADGTYELVPTHEADAADVQVNALELIQDPNQCSKEPKASSAQEGKARCF